MFHLLKPETNEHVFALVKSTLILWSKEKSTYNANIVPNPHYRAIKEIGFKLRNGKRNYNQRNESAGYSRTFEVNGSDCYV